MGLKEEEETTAPATTCGPPAGPPPPLHGPKQAIAHTHVARTAYAAQYCNEPTPGQQTSLVIAATLQELTALKARVAELQAQLQTQSQEVSKNRTDIQRLQERTQANNAQLLEDQREDKIKIAYISGWLNLGKAYFTINEQARYHHLADWCQKAEIRQTSIQQSPVTSASHLNSRGEPSNTSIVAFHSNSDRNKFIKWWNDSTGRTGDMRIEEAGYTSRSVLRVRSGQTQEDDARTPPRQTTHCILGALRPFVPKRQETLLPATASKTGRRQDGASGIPQRRVVHSKNR